jgi:hypothetical protein
MIDEEKKTFEVHKCPCCLGYGSFSHGKVPCKTCGTKGFIAIKIETRMNEIINEGMTNEKHTPNKT